jgi:histidinol phosphatase-like PHP family hydrolase
MARDLGIPVCFGDDSHRAEDVGVGIPEARAFLLDHGVTTITCLRRETSGLGRVVIPLA